MAKKPLDRIELAAEVMVYLFEAYALMGLDYHNAAGEKLDTPGKVARCIGLEGGVMLKRRDNT